MCIRDRVSAVLRGVDVSVILPGENNHRLVDLSLIHISCHALLHKRDSRAALGWIAIILFMPPVGLPLYWLFGIARIDSQAVRLMEKAAQKGMGGLGDRHGKSLTEKPEGFIDKDEGPHAWHYLVNPGSSITGRCMLCLLYTSFDCENSLCTAGSFKDLFNPYKKFQHF